MEVYIKVYIKMEKSMDLVDINGQMEVSMKAVG
jgi:hypothetical protein